MLSRKAIDFVLDIALPLKHNVYMNKLDSAKRSQVIGALVEGAS
jgi:hypothetical protein